MRQRLHEIIYRAKPGDTPSELYDIFIALTAVISVTPLMIKGTHPILDLVDIVTVYILFADYLLRWITVDLSPAGGGVRAFFTYPFRLLPILAMLSLLPSLGLLGPAFRIMRIFRILIILPYSKNYERVVRVFGKERKTLSAVLFLALGYIFISALAIFSYEPDTFEDFFGAVYWATVSLTTVGYGDVYPVSDIGRLISMISSFFGIAVIALPAGIITAGFVDEIKAAEEEEQGAPSLIERRHLKITPLVKRYALIMTIGVILNQSLALLAERFNLPVWLDTVGTLYVTIVLEPTAGLIIAIVDSLILAITTYGAASIFYYVVAAAVVLIVGCWVMADGVFIKKRILPGILLVFLASAFLEAGIEFMISGLAAPVPHWQNFFYRQALAAGAGEAMAIFFGMTVVKAFDTVVTAALLFVLYRLTPQAYRSVNNA